MAMPQEQLLAAEFMPRRAQENLPVMPNNGNPRTIYNMPGTGGNAPVPQHKLPGAASPCRNQVPILLSVDGSIS